MVPSAVVNVVHSAAAVLVAELPGPAEGEEGTFDGVGAAGVPVAAADVPAVPAAEDGGWELPGCGEQPARNRIARDAA
ncbi:hypothetical protein QFZ35_001356 [Arthrobacter ulcerisalmonis]|uniref:hypothetical protein n=1 Tax=Arthrobacter sp. B1I2 TaxID=3042263 RepID=UPI0027945FF9|nr:MULTISPECIES: hypothetical protein [Arthrobacter]MDQ0662858.1 hypothetical protein [Arthrobacter ulcerisalmonis]